MSLLLARAAQNHRSGAGGGDPYWNNVISLLHFDGVNGSTIFTDEKGFVWAARHGSPKLSTAFKKFGTASLSSSYELGGSIGRDAIAFLDKDFTIESWCTQTGPINGNSGWFGQRNGSTTNASLAFIFSGTHPLMDFQYSTTGADSKTIIFNAPYLNDSVAHWIKFVRVGGNIYLFIDGESMTVYSGTQIGSDIIHTPTSDAKFLIGQPTDDAANVAFYPGYVDEFRLTLGIGRLDTVIPTAPFPNHA